MNGKEFIGTPDRSPVIELSSGGQLSLGEESRANYTQDGDSKYSDSFRNSSAAVENSNLSEKIACEGSSGQKVHCIEDFNLKPPRTSKKVDGSTELNNRSILLTIFCCVGSTSNVKNLKISYLVTTFLASSIVFVFLQELVFSQLSNGYSIMSTYEKYLLGPPSQIIFDMGALDTNLVRNGQVIRLFWSFWLHTSFVHLLINLSSQVILGIILETRWVIWRYAILYFVGGLVGNLASAVLDPCSVSAGSSACFFALLAGIIILLLENWRNSRWQFLYVLLVCLASLMGISLSFMSNTDNWAHIGGFVAGLLWSLASMESFPSKRKIKMRNYSNNSFKKIQNNSFMDMGTTPNSQNKSSDVEVGKVYSINHSCSLVNSCDLENKKKYSYFYQRFVPINCVCSGGVQTIRVISLLLLLSILTLGFIFLLYRPIYTRFNVTLGHLSFSGIQACSCCNSPEGIFWCSSSPAWIKRCG